MRLRCTVLVTTLAVASGTPGADAPPASAQISHAPAKVLYIGNSYTFYHRMPATVAAMSRADTSPRELHATVVAVPGATLEHHWASEAARNAIRARKWDYVVLQEQSLLPLEQKERMYKTVRLLDQEIKQNGARTVLFVTWARQDQPETQRALTAAYHAIAQELGALIAPVGPAWQIAREGAADPSLYEPDGSHPSVNGSYLAACVIYLTLQPTESQCPPPQSQNFAVTAVETLRAAAASAVAGQRR